MTDSILIKNGTLLLPDGERKADLFVRNGRIASIGSPVPEDADVLALDASGCLVLPGLADVHVHFREPGFSYKETIATGSLAAAAGGFTCVCPMPNLDPAPDSVENIEKELGIIRKDACIDVCPYATITMGRKGRQVVDVASLKDLCCGFSDDGSGVQDDRVMLGAMQACASCDCILAAHCEDDSLLCGGYIHDGKYAAMHGHRGICSESEWGQIARDLELAGQTGCAYHVCHISTKESVDIIRMAKARGVDVTCETAPHYLCLCEDDLQEDGRFKMNPPLRAKEDKEALIQGLADGTIDIIATDHAPHGAEEKSRGLAGSAMGVTGLECSFPVLYTSLVKTGVISLGRLVEAMCINPRRRFRLGGGLLQVGADADIAVFDVSAPYRIDPDNFLSKGKSTPFAGMQVYGKNKLTLYRGNIAYYDKL